MSQVKSGWEIIIKNIAKRTYKQCLPYEQWARLSCILVNVVFLFGQVHLPIWMWFHTVILAYLHICAYLHMCILAYLHTSMLACLHTCILAFLYTGMLIVIIVFICNCFQKSMLRNSSAFWKALPTDLLTYTHFIFYGRPSKNAAIPDI